MTILPPRPLRLDPRCLARLRRQTLIATVLFLILGAGFSAGCVYCLREVRAERALWRRGVSGEIQSLSGTVTETSKLGITLIYDYELEVDYLDSTGGLHRGKTEFDLFWSPLDERHEASLRYDPADPERFVLSSPIEAGVSRWAFAALMGVLGAGMLFGLVTERRSTAARMRWFDLCALDGEEILAPIQSVAREEKAVRVKFSLPGRAKATQERLGAEPLVVEVANVPHVVVLRSPRDPESRVVVQADLAPFAFDPAARAAILERAAQRA